MAGIIPLPPFDVDDSDSHDSLLLLFFCLNLKIAYEHECKYLKGCIGKSGGIYQFVFKLHVNKQKEDWSVPLPNLPITWIDMCVEGILLPAHISHTFLCFPVSLQQLTFDPVTLFVSAFNLLRECPPKLLKALADSHPDCEVWLQSYQEEKRSLESLNTYRKITHGEYRALHKKGAPCAIPTMCVLTSKHDENYHLFVLKSPFGNHKNRVWSKLDKFAPVLWGDSLGFLVSMAVQKRCPLCQGRLQEFILPRHSPSWQSHYHLSMFRWPWRWPSRILASFTHPLRFATKSLSLVWQD